MAEDTSILQEIDEALRADRLEKFWANNSGAVITFCVLLVISSAASVLWKNHQHEVRAHTTGMLSQAVMASDAGNYADAVALYEKVEEDGGALAGLAALRKADTLLKMNQPDKAIAFYVDIASGKVSGAQQSLRDYASLQADILTHNDAIANNKTAPQDAVSPAGGETYANSRKELDALRALKAGDSKGASSMLGAVVADESAPFSERARAAQLLGSIRGDKK